MTVSFPNVRVGEPVTYRSLTVYPLFTEEEGTVEYLLADEAIREESLTVSEVSEGGSVPELLVENKGDTRVLFIEGEELLGAKQNRILNTSILVAARTKAKIPVSCVEEGRWGYRSRHFDSGGTHSPSKLRSKMKASVTKSLKEKRGHRSDQGAVWSEVHLLHAALSVESPSHAMHDAYHAHQETVSESRDQLKYVPGASGLAAALGDKITGCDLFDKPSTCEKVWDRLMTGLVFDAMSSNTGQSQPERCDIEEFVSNTNTAAWEQADPIGEGDEFRAEIGGGDHASALTFNDQLVHGSLLAGV